MTNRKPKKRAPKKTGRKSTLEIAPQITMALCAAITIGTPIKYACVLAGIGETTFHRWMEQGEKAAEEGVKSPYRAFRESITRARANKIESCLANIKRAAKLKNKKTGQLDWKAEAWLLEHTEQDTFGSKSKVEVSGKNDGPISVEIKTWLDVVRSATEKQ